MHLLEQIPRPLRHQRQLLPHLFQQPLKPFLRQRQHRFQPQQMRQHMLLRLLRQPHPRRLHRHHLRLQLIQSPGKTRRRFRTRTHRSKPPQLLRQPRNVLPQRQLRQPPHRPRRPPHRLLRPPKQPQIHQPIFVPLQPRIPPHLRPPDVLHHHPLRHIPKRPALQIIALKPRHQFLPRIRLHLRLLHRTLDRPQIPRRHHRPLLLIHHLDPRLQMHRHTIHRPIRTRHFHPIRLLQVSRQRRQKLRPPRFKSRRHLRRLRLDRHQLLPDRPRQRPQ